jgi:hypothetical protein
MILFTRADLELFHHAVLNRKSLLDLDINEIWLSLNWIHFRCRFNRLFFNLLLRSFFLLVSSTLLRYHETKSSKDSEASDKRQN